MVRNKRKFGWAFRSRGTPFLVPASFSNRLPSGSRSGLSRSSTVGLQRFAFSKRTQLPSSIALVSAPSTHSNLQSANKRVVERTTRGVERTNGEM